MIRASDLSSRDVINTVDGRKLGNIVDIEFDLTSGRITAVIVPGPARGLGIFGRGDDYVIPWENVKKIGEDVILVELAERYSRRQSR
ncbi:MAG: YlmC/YmxH family sporulation protein [Firmicutes bacterium]|nr:YlmC/YmxH family sporulation protein [Candidatus Fermentithermobacillaceae bacterium]